MSKGLDLKRITSPPPDEQEVLKLISELMQVLPAIRSNPVDHPEVSDLVDAFHELLSSFLAHTGKITLEELHNHLRVNESLLSLSAHQNDYIQGFIFYLLQKNLRSITFRHPIDQNQTRAFFNLLREPKIFLSGPKELKKHLKKAGMEHIDIALQVSPPRFDPSKMTPPRPLEIHPKTAATPEPAKQKTAPVEPIATEPEPAAPEFEAAEPEPQIQQTPDFTASRDEEVSFAAEEEPNEPEADLDLMQEEMVTPGELGKDPEIPDKELDWTSEPAGVDPIEIEQTLGDPDSSAPVEFEDQVESFQEEDEFFLQEEQDPQPHQETPHEAQPPEPPEDVDGILFRVFVGSYPLEGVVIKVLDFETLSKKTERGTGAVFDLEPGEYDIEIDYENHILKKQVVITPSMKNVDIDLQSIQNY